MKKTIYNHYDKNAIVDLPKAVFNGKIVVIQSAAEAEKAVDFLMSQSVLGIDTETRPAFKKGQSHLVSLLQVSTYDVCFLFRLNFIGITASLKRLLENTEIPMIGLSLHDDIAALNKRKRFKSGHFIDIQSLVGEFGIEDLSLQKLFANLFHQHISKRQQLSNWEADVLSEKQKLYAATDAWACLMIYDELKRFHDTHDYKLVKVAEPENEQVTITDNTSKQDDI